MLADVAAQAIVDSHARVDARLVVLVTAEEAAVAQVADIFFMLSISL